MIFTIKKLLTCGLLLLATLVLVWTVGLGLFLHGLYSQNAIADNIHSDAIVVLTGGDDRVREGIRLLDMGIGDKLLISGVGQGATIEDILRTSGYAHLIKNDAFKARITLGHRATNTRGNAEETHKWAIANNIHSIRMVTAYYHMPRSQLEFHAEMPQMLLLLHPVHPMDFELSKKDGLRLAFFEYHKFIAVLLRQAGLWHIT